MIEKKTSPISEHKHEDVVHLRKVLLEIVDDDTCTKKDRIEASKLLLRTHHSLQIDKSVTATANAQAKFANLSPPKLKPALQETLRGLLKNAKSS
ncbi:hypothetical protein LCGC14_2684180 [marine sediment metagenome]|uniref:Uncharacterized protein n=1 Tax=marine sediment metagenome TaxID=412755 RepID=A0A0F9A7Z4_9ZZZZ